MTTSRARHDAPRRCGTAATRRLIPPRISGALCAVVVCLCLVARAVEAQGLVINEVMSSNSATLLDDAGESPDWVEVLNTGAVEIQLEGHGLSDNAAPLKWVFPNLLLPPGGRAVVFCSEREPSSVPSHWETVIAEGDAWRYIVPVAEPAAAWRQPEFADAGWRTGAAGIGYGDGDDRTEVPAGTISVYARKAFSVGDPDDVLDVFLHIDFDDAFVAYLNGVEIARENIGSPGLPPAFSEVAATSTEPRLVTGGKLFQYREERFRSLIRAGENVLAVQVHNAGSSSSDLSLIPFLTLGMTRPPPNARGPAGIIKPSLPGLHASFKIAAEGETITLASPGGAIIDSVATGFLPVDISIGRFPDGTGAFSIHSPATPGAPNASPGYAAVGGAVTFSRTGGFHPGPVTVSLSTSGTSGTIFVTTDGSMPTESSPAYAGPIQVASTRVVRARVLGAGLFPGENATHTYIIGRTSTLPVVSISTDPANLFDSEIGIYVTGTTYDPSFPYFGSNFWEDWERPVHLELYEPDGTVGFSAGAGAAIFGGWSRGNPQRSLALFARRQYGPGKFSHRIFPEKDIDGFEAFVLRNSGNDWQITHFRDAMMTSLVKDLGIDRQAYRPSAVFINGEYWGILNLREKVNEHFLAANHPGVSSDQIDLLEANGRAIHGDTDHYNAALALLQGNVADPAVYGQIEAMIDIENFIDYQAAQIYFDNTDWPGNNIKFWRPRVEGGRWRWILFDTDFGFGIWNAGNYVNNTLAFALEPNGPDWPNPPWSTLVLRRLVTNPLFVEDFVNRFLTHLSTVFSPSKVIARVNEMAAALEPEMPAHRARWGSNVSAWRASVQVLRDFASRRIPYVRSQLGGRFGLSATGVLGITIAAPGGGIVEVQGVPIREYPFSGTYFQALPVRLAARPDPGYRFLRWSGVEAAMGREATVTVSASALALSAAFERDCSAAGDVVINEIQYNPPVDADPGDWVEIHNRTQAELDIGGWTLRDSGAETGYTIPAGTVIPDGGHVVLCSSSAAFSSLHPAAGGCIGDTGFSLSGSGETISLFDASGRLVDEVAYEDSAPWPAEADGGGATLALRNPGLENSDAASWAASGAGGTPGARNDVFVPMEDCVESGPYFLRGDCNGDGVVAISDAIRLLLASFAGAPVPCWTACDADGSGSASGVTDTIHVLRHLFAGGPPPASPFPACGPLEDPDLALGCAAPPAGCR
jgi:hypothetical protein